MIYSVHLYYPFDIVAIVLVCLCVGVGLCSHVRVCMRAACTLNKCVSTFVRDAPHPPPRGASPQRSRAASLPRGKDFPYLTRVWKRERPG